MSVPPPSYAETTAESESNKRPPSYGETTAKPNQRNVEQESRLTAAVTNVVLDNTLIRSDALPATGHYQLTHPLDCGFSAIGISRLVPRTTLGTHERHIYDFSKPIFSSHVEIVGKRRSALTGTVILTTFRGLMRTGWEVLHETKDGKKPLFKVRPTRRPERQSELQWEDARGSLVAVEKQPHSSADSRPRFHIVAPLDETMTDILVTAWCARIWHEISDAAIPVEDYESSCMFLVCSRCRCYYTSFIVMIYSNRIVHDSSTENEIWTWNRHLN